MNPDRSFAPQWPLVTPSTLLAVICPAAPSGASASDADDTMCHPFESEGGSQSLQRSAERVRGRYRRPTEASWSRADGSASAYTSPINPADRRFDRRCVVAGFKALSPLMAALTPTTPTHPQHDSQPLMRLPATQIRRRVSQGSQEGGATRHRFKARANPRPHTKHSLNPHFCAFWTLSMVV